MKSKVVPSEIIVRYGNWLLVFDSIISLKVNFGLQTKVGLVFAGPPSLVSDWVCVKSCQLELKSKIVPSEIITFSINARNCYGEFGIFFASTNLPYKLYIICYYWYQTVCVKYLLPSLKWSVPSESICPVRKHIFEKFVIIFVENELMFFYWNLGYSSACFNPLYMSFHLWMIIFLDVIDLCLCPIRNQFKGLSE